MVYDNITGVNALQPMVCDYLVLKCNTKIPVLYCKDKLI